MFFLKNQALLTKILRKRTLSILDSQSGTMSHVKGQEENSFQRLFRPGLFKLESSIFQITTVVCTL